MQNHVQGEACPNNTNITSIVEEAISRLRQGIHIDFSDLLKNKERECIQNRENKFQLLDYAENAWIGNDSESVEELLLKYGNLKALQVVRSMNLTDTEASVLFQYLESSSFQYQCERFRNGLEFYENFLGSNRNKSTEIQELEYLQAS